MRSLLVLAGLAALLANVPAAAAEEAVAAGQSAEPAIAAENVAVVEKDAAEDTAKLSEPDLTIVTEEELYEEEVYVSPLPEVVLPGCDDSRLMALVMAKIAGYHQQHQAANLLEKRRQALLLKHLQKFSELPVVGFTSKENFNVANNLLMTKINNGLDDKQLRLCRNEGGGKAGDIYLLIYPHGDDIRVNILNYLANQASKEDFSFLYL